MTQPGSTRRVCAIGLDAADWTLVERLLEAGELPHLAQLRARSAFASLNHADFRTGLAWEHFVTGKSARAAGRWAAIEFDPATYATWKEGAKLVEPFFGASAVETIAFDVPYLSRAFPVPGAQVTGWGGHDPGYPPGSNPRPLYAEIERRFGVHPASANDYEIVWNGPALMERLAEALVVGTRRRADIVSWLAQQHPDWRLLMTVLSEPHSANEQYWHGIDESHPVAPVSGATARRCIEEVYRAVDDAVGRIVDRVGDDVTYVVFALHGGAVNEADVPAMVLLPELLHRLHGQTAVLACRDLDEWRASGAEPLVLEPDRRWNAHMFAASQVQHGRVPLTRRLRSTLPGRALGTLGQVRRGALRPAATSVDPPRVGVLGIPIPAESDQAPEEIGVPRGSIDWQFACRYKHWWPGMRYFALPTFYDGRVRLNVRGRERSGLVEPSDYVAVCDEVEREVRACRDARTGAEVVARVNRLRADDPMAAGGPEADLEIIFSGVSDAWVHPTLGDFGPLPFRRTGGHSPQGFMMVAGPGVEPRDLGQHSANDVPPTLLSLLHGAVPDDLDIDGAPLIS